MCQAGTKMLGCTAQPVAQISNAVLGLVVSRIYNTYMKSCIRQSDVKHKCVMTFNCVNMMTPPKTTCCKLELEVWRCTGITRYFRKVWTFSTSCSPPFRMGLLEYTPHPYPPSPHQIFPRIKFGKFRLRIKCMLFRFEIIRAGGASRPRQVCGLKSPKII